MNRRSRPLAALLTLALVAAACTTRSTTPGYGNECAGFHPDPENPFFGDSPTYHDATPMAWGTSNPATVGIDAAILETAAENVALSPDAASLLVVRHGRLVFERYFNGFEASDANHLYSLTKSITSVLTGIAIDEGRLLIDTRIDELLPAGLVVANGDLTVRDLLTMSGGLEVPKPDGNYEWEPSNVPGEPSLIRAILSSSRVAEPGTEFSYDTGLTQVLAAVVAEAAGMSLCEYAADRLLGPLGIDVEGWWIEPGGYFSGGIGMFLTPREIARFGQLVLDRGAHGYRRLVSEDWVDESLSERWDLGCLRQPNIPRSYGYLWWGPTILGHEVWIASGFGGQDVAIVSDLDLVVVMTHDVTGDVTPRVNMPALLYELVIGAVDGGETPGPSSECKPTSLQLATVAADGTGSSSLVDGWPDAAGAFSPDGKHLAFSRNYLGLWELFIVDVQSREVRRVTHDNVPDVMPSWSPDGSTIAFARGEPADTDIYVVNPNGSALSRLTDLDGYEQSPTWSPDGTRIAFVSGDDDVNGWGHPGRLWVIDSDGFNLEPLLERDVSNPTWSPDGSRIAFDSLGGGHRIGVLDLASGVVSDLGEGFSPRWSPDGDRIAFGVLDGAGGSDVFTMAADGSDRLRLTNDPAFDGLPYWSVDGRTIFYWTVLPARETYR
ncbi:MAG: serine hydrolase [Acidimicrobiia bacterium]